MSVSVLYLGVFFITIFTLYWREIFQLARRRWKVIKALHTIPGPVALPLIGTVWQLKFDPRALTKQLLDWGSYYSALGHNIIKIWIGPRPAIMIIRPEAAKSVLESSTLITKGDEYDILIPWLGTGLLISTGAKWQQRRKMLTSSFHFKILNEFVSVFNYQAKILMDQIEKYSTVRKHFDIFPYIKRCALDIICETAMGTTISAQTDHDHEYVISVKRMMELAIKYHRRPWLQIQLLWWLTGYEKEYDQHLKVVTDFTKKVIADKMNSTVRSVEGRKSFLDMLLELYREGQLGYEDIREEVDTFMFAGHDTTSTSIGWTLWCLAKHPECQKKVQEEIKNVFGSSDRDITSEDLKYLKYLERCIKEGLRVRPTVPYFVRKVDEDIEIDNKLIPEGCSVIVCPFMIHRDKDHFENPSEFNPDRFLEENSSERHPYAFMPFSAGPRNCIGFKMSRNKHYSGQKFAMMEEKIILAWFFRKYCVGSKVSFEENLLLPLAITRPIFGFPIYIQKRF